MRRLCVLVCFAVFSATQTWAQEPVGCDKFKLPVEKEMTALRVPGLKAVVSGSNVSAIPFAATMLLLPSNAANLPRAPERLPKSDTFAGFLSVAAVSPGTYSISLSDAAWIDVILDDHFQKASAHSVAQGCNGIRKVLRFELTGEPSVVQISGSPTVRLNIAILPTE